MDEKCYDIAFISNNSFFVGGDFDNIMLFDVRVSKFISKFNISKSVTSTFGSYGDDYLLIGHC